jgi:hypothetical protein
MYRKRRTSSIVTTTLPGQRKKPPSLLYPPTTHAVCESASRRAGTVIRLIKFQAFPPADRADSEGRAAAAAPPAS